MAAALRAFLGLAATLAVLAQMALGANHVVGGVGGWALGSDMQTWASARAFQTDDTLTFSYASLHSVVEVSEADYDACSLSNPKTSFAGGNTIIKLSAPGKRYFICGTAGHCSGGMKVTINTVSAAAAAPPPATLVTPPVATPPPMPPNAPSPPPATLVTPPAASPPTMPSNAPSAPPSKAPLNAPSTDSPTMAPALTPTASPAATPASDFPETAPSPRASASNTFRPLAMIGVGLASMLMTMVL